MTDTPRSDYEKYSKRLETLKDQFCKLKSYNQRLLEKVEELLKRPHFTKTSESNPPPDKKTGLKPSPPSEFNGDRTKGRAFLNSCEFYRAALFADRLMQHESWRGRKYRSWADFRANFVDEFCPKNEAQLSLAKLETAACRVAEYYQGKKPVDKYVDGFRELIEMAGYTEGLAIVVKFHCGLQRDIQDQIALMGFGHPGDDDPEAWYEAAIRCDENRITNAVFHNTLQALLVKATGTPTLTFSRYSPPTWNTKQLTTATSTPPPPSTATSGQTPADPAWRKTGSPIACHWCGSSDHLKPECPHQFNIRFMTMDEKESWLQDVVLEADIVQIQETEKELESAEQGFVNRNE
jgi:hypothetical protein